MIKIRQAEQKDLPYIVPMYRAGLKELGETKIIESCLVNKVVTSRQLAPCFLLTINGIIRGILGLTIAHSSHNGDAMLSEYMFYIQPEHRALKHLSALIKEAQGFALANDLSLRMDFVNDAPLKVRKRLFDMHNFKIKSIAGVYNGR
tara:strand:- start:2925 stop:3365 length:441 start_codon:yes stop_codon:yes gene_type:complete